VAIPRRILLAVPHGFCAGVERAIGMAGAVLRTRPPPVYCLNEIVHNPQVTEDLARRGIVFVRDVGEIPRGATTLFSAHGVAPAVREAAAERRLNVIDATCPFVSKVHAEVRRFAGSGYAVLLIGHRTHEEVVGVAGEAPEQVTVIQNEDDARAARVPDPASVAVITQTTLSTDEAERLIAILRSRFPALRTPPQSDICYATRNRQRAVRALARGAEFIVVLGAENSSNSNRLVEVARSAGCRAALVSATELLPALSLDDVKVVGLTAGASTPESCVAEALELLKRRGFSRVEELVAEREDIHFALPRDLEQSP
jgi:4-hydroxy-3-methylbut-2-en-1-yl diphosphate reductase